MAGFENCIYLQKKKIQMDDEKLIKMVQQNSALYDVDHSRYADASYRERIWKQISEEVKQPPLFCKKRWGNIRDNFKKALKKMALKTELGHTTMKKYKYSELLEFLGYTVEDRESINVSPVEIKTELDMDNNTEESENFDNFSQSDTKASETDDEEKCTQLQVSKHNRGVKRKREESGKEISKLMRYMADNVEIERAVGTHPVDAFLSGIAPTLKSLSPYYLSLAKTQIYSIVQEYEMAMIMELKKT